jgi:glutamine amidotransferase
MMIALIDYGMGNLHSVSKALHQMGYEIVITDDPQVLRKAKGLILPGVGAFGDAMYELSKRQLVGEIQQLARAGKPLLGICVGMQLLFTSSEEHGFHQGLNLLPGSVVQFRGDYLVPHMGWNWLRFLQPHPLFQGLEEDYVYFVHSYYVQADNQEDVIATTEYHQSVPAVFAHDHIFGMQFHPEKSGHLGRQLLKRFAQICEEKVGEHESGTLSSH